MTPSPKSTTETSTSTINEDGHSNRLSAAADLIRNLDAALSEMNHAATSAAQDAARARKNARAAGEVARRYGGVGNAVGGKKSPRGGVAASSSSWGGDNNYKSTKDDQFRDAEQRALERKWERRTATRLAAEARQRRENHNSSLSSPRKQMDGFTAVVNETVMQSREHQHVHYQQQQQHLHQQQHQTQQPQYENEPPNHKAHGNYYSSNSNTAQEHENHAAHPTENISTNDGTDQSYATIETFEFEDAMDNHNEEKSQGGASVLQSDQQPPSDDDGGGGGGYDVQGEQYEDNVGEEQQYQQQWQNGEQQQDVAQGDYYNQQQQQQQYYNNQEQQNQQQMGYYNQDHHQQQQNQQYSEQTWDASTQQQQQQQKQQQHQMQPPSTATTRIEASHAEDVLSLSLSLEQTRHNLTTTTSTLHTTQSQLSHLQSTNTHLQSEIARLQSELQTARTGTSQQVVEELEEKYRGEFIRAEAAEEDAALALELAKEAQLAKEEVEIWLNRSLEEIDLWKGRVSELESEMKEQQQQQQQHQQQQQGLLRSHGDGNPNEPKKLVRFADQSQVPPSPVASVMSEDGTSTTAAAHDHSPAPATPTSSSSTPTRGNNNDNTTPSKSAIASGRAWLHRNSPLMSPTPSGSNNNVGLSPHPRLQAAELLKRSAETRKNIREKLGANSTNGGLVGGSGRWASPGSSSSGGPTPPPSMALIAATAANAKHNTGGDGSLLSSLNDNNFASRQGAACRAVGKTIRESGHRLKLGGNWWGSTKALADGISSNGGDKSSGPVIEGVAELESMVRDYCCNVEGTIGKQKEQISELVAFCDHLEREVVKVNVDGAADTASF